MPGFPPMGGMSPSGAEAMDAAGMQLSPQQIMMLQQIRAQQGAQPPGGPGVAMPPGGALPPGAAPGGAPGMEGGPPGGMSQADFSGYGRVTPPDMQAAKAQQQIQLLRLLARQQQQGYGQ